jgi:hypothetical protein
MSRGSIANDAINLDGDTGGRRALCIGSYMCRKGARLCEVAFGGFDCLICGEPVLFLSTFVRNIMKLYYIQLLWVNFEYDLAMINLIQIEFPAND